MRFNTIGIICAMDEEMEQVVLHLDHVHTVLEQAGLKFIEGTASGLTVYVVRCGIGKVNSALCSQIMIDKLDPDAVLNIGVAGALDDALEQGDILISRSAQQHDFDTSQLGDPKGIISRMDTSIFPADPDLIQAAEEAAEAAGLHYCLGKVVSGDQFIADEAKKNELIELFQGSCAEMEGAAMAHVCYLNRKPWVILRSISDKADGQAELSYPEFLPLATKRAGVLFQHIIEKL
ncbi:MAG: 5'-methylthioadenosine/adenosylhomocysteine nucleosidase [Clostridiales bacterium]|nr:5'-methylthioadenosine/adenosylhomocysteine nucleosidase [Clostridiales bacterium]